MYVEIDVPELPEYPRRLIAFWTRLLMQPISADYRIHVLAATYMRLVEAACVELQLGVAKLRELWGTGDGFNLGGMLRSTAHFETCLSVMHRAIRCYRALHRRNDPLATMLSAAKPRFVSDAVVEDLRQVRDAIQHIEEKVINGKLKQGQPMILRATGDDRPHKTEPNQTVLRIDRLVIGDRAVTFAALQEILSEMVLCAEKIAAYDAGVTA